MAEESKYIDDAIWADEIRKGDQIAWTQFFSSMKGRLLYFTQGIIQDQHESRSIVSDAFMVLWGLKDQLSSLDDMKTLLYNRCRWQAYNWNKYHGSRHRALEVLTDDFDTFSKAIAEDNTAQNEIHQAEILYEFYRAISFLPEKQRVVMELLLNGNSSVEIATLLNISASTVRTLKSLAVSRIQQHMAKKDLLTLTLLLLINNIITD
jgi:RNA polymerase sigma-70 factor (ECF subfamily)